MQEPAEQQQHQQRPDFVYQQLQEEAERVESQDQGQGAGVENGSDEVHQDEAHG